jgi:hypothetical protein
MARGHGHALKRESAESCPLLGHWVREHMWREQYIAMLGELSRADKDFVRPQSSRYWANLKMLVPALFEPPPPAAPVAASSSDHNNATATTTNRHQPQPSDAATTERLPHYHSQRQRHRHRCPSEVCFTTTTTTSGRQQRQQKQQTGGVAGIISVAGVLLDSLRDLAWGYSGRVVQHKISHRRKQLKVDELADLYAAVSLVTERGALLGDKYDDDDADE